MNATPPIFVLTRTAGRPSMFARARASVLEQARTYDGWVTHIVHAEDTPETKAYAEADYLVVGERLERKPTERCPWERYQARLLRAAASVASAALWTNAWILFLDDDDELRPGALASVPWSTLGPTSLPIWRTERERGRISPATWRGDLGTLAGRICWESAALHVAALAIVPAIDGDDGADGRFWHALSRRLEPVWLDDLPPLARPQVGKGKGRTSDYAPR